MLGASDHEGPLDQTGGRGGLQRMLTEDRSRGPQAQKNREDGGDGSALRGPVCRASWRWGTVEVTRHAGH